MSAVEHLVSRYGEDVLNTGKEGLMERPCPPGCLGQDEPYVFLGYGDIEVPLEEVRDAVVGHTEKMEVHDHALDTDTHLGILPSTEGAARVADESEEREPETEEEAKERGCGGGVFTV